MTRDPEVGEHEQFARISNAVHRALIDWSSLTGSTRLPFSDRHMIACRTWQHFNPGSPYGRDGARLTPDSLAESRPTE